MDFEQDSSQSEQFQPPEPVYSIETKKYNQPKKRSRWRVFWGIFTGLSVLSNIFLFLMLICLAAFLAVGRTDILTEHVIADGPRTSKIAVIHINGIIDSQQYQDFRTQIKRADNDDSVKGLILQVDSPGGTIADSDRIHNELNRYRNQTSKPVVAFMNNLAASGGYYVSVACDKIIAEPTTITGSIGVIMGYLVLQDLLEGKLGIQPVIVKAGEKKDWPSSFQPPTEEQLKYLDERIITPAYERFISIVADSREVLDTEQVKVLADGSIYTADQALNNQLIDQIGYLDEAIEEVKSLAGITEAQVVEYRKPFSFANILGAKNNILKINKMTLYELGTPQIMYLWSIY